jgi:hypothetical protein
MNAAACLVLDLGRETTRESSTTHPPLYGYQQKIKLNTNCLLVHLALNRLAHSYITELLTPTAAVSGRVCLPSASTDDLVVPKTRLKSGEHAVCLVGPQHWNRLPTELKIKHFSLIS